MKNITAIISETAREKFGITAVKPFQLLVMHRILEQVGRKTVRNQMVILPTGTGKSLCFLLPGALINGITIIIYPLLALMNDQMSELSKSGIECVCLRGGQTKKQRKSIINKLRNGTKIIISNPETLSQEKVLKLLEEFEIELLVVDEAHVIHQWGQTFRPAYLKIQNIIEELNPHQIIAFTATASEKTLISIKDCLFKETPILVRGDSDRENIFYRAFPTLNRKQALKQIIGFCNRPAIVFCGTRSNTYNLCHTMMRLFPAIPMRYYHAGLSKEERETLEKWFMESKDGILFCTCAFGMGVNKRSVRTVVHYQLPSSVEEYLQESGRAGRDRKQSEAIVIITKDDKSKLAEIFKNQECRRHQLLNELGEEKDECSGCDVCTDTQINEPYGENVIKKLIKSRPFKYNSHSAARLLSGSSFARNVPVAKRIDPFYGSVDFEQDYLTDAIESLSFKVFNIIDSKKLLKKNFQSNQLKR